MSTMTRQHFELIAETINEALNRELEIEAEGNDTKLAQTTLKALSYRFAAKLKVTNPNFDRAKFILACGKVS